MESGSKAPDSALPDRQAGMPATVNLTLAPRERSGNGPAPLVRTKLTLDYLKVLAWPILIVSLLVAYRPPLSRMAESLASKLDKADTVKIGSFSLEVQERARDLGHPELGREIGQLSFDAIEELVRTPRTGDMILLSTNEHVSPPEYGLPPDAELAGLLELEKKGLIAFTEPIDEFLGSLRRVGQTLKRDSTARSEDRQWFLVQSADAELTRRLRHQGYRLTEAGRRAVEAISKAVAAQLARPE